MAKKDDLYKEICDKLIGNKFSRLTVISFAYSKNHRRYWLCSCDCGKTTFGATKYLLNGDKKSCGCLVIDQSKINSKNMHLKSPVVKRNELLYRNGKKHKLTNILKSMKQRCYNPNSRIYKWYGGKGIEIYELWKNEPASFIKWCEDNGYSDDKEIDRIDPNLGYFPENCQFLTKQEHIKKTFSDQVKYGKGG